MTKILIVDDDKAVVSALKILLKQNGYSIECAYSPEQAIQIVRTNALDIALVDLNYRADTTSGEEGLELIRKLHYINSDLALIAMTGWSSVELAVSCLQAGANDYIEKPWDNSRLITILKNQESLSNSNREKAKLKTENSLLQEELRDENDFTFVANSGVMQELLETVHKVSETDLNIFISGENGSGKGVLAKYIHRCSNRKNEKLVAVNTGAISESLFESDMFGHVKGAFTDAKENRVGRFELANKGTLFLDEIGNLPLPQQAKILRVLEEQQFEKVGSSITITTDVRIISATNADIYAMVQQGKFRQDLLYRLNSIELRLPALRERRDDILPLAEMVMEKCCKRYSKALPVLSKRAEKVLLSYPWPGNIRELQHVIERSMILCDGHKIEEKDLALGVQAASPVLSERQADDEFSRITLAEIERRVIEERIELHGGNMTDAARSLGLSRSAFYRRLEKLDIK